MVMEILDTANVAQPMPARRMTALREFEGGISRLGWAARPRPVAARYPLTYVKFVGNDLCLGRRRRLLVHRSGWTPRTSASLAPSLTTPNALTSVTLLGTAPRGFRQRRGWKLSDGG